jgi:hypothetical protein
MSTNIMRALRFAEFGPPSVLRIECAAIPEPGEGEALIHVKAAAINPGDIRNVACRFKNTTLPRTPGRWLLTKKIQATDAASAHIVGERKDQQQRPNVQFAISTVRQRSHQ